MSDSNPVNDSSSNRKATHDEGEGDDGLVSALRNLTPDELISRIQILESELINRNKQVAQLLTQTRVAMSEAGRTKFLESENIKIKKQLHIAEERVDKLTTENRDLKVQVGKKDHDEKMSRYKNMLSSDQFQEAGYAKKILSSSSYVEHGAEGNPVVSMSSKSQTDAGGQDLGNGASSSIGTASQARIVMIGGQRHVVFPKVPQSAAGDEHQLPSSSSSLAGPRDTSHISSIGFSTTHSVSTTNRSNNNTAAEGQDDATTTLLLGEMAPEDEETEEVLARAKDEALFEQKALSREEEEDKQLQARFEALLQKKK